MTCNAVCRPFVHGEKLFSVMLLLVAAAAARAAVVVAAIDCRLVEESKPALECIPVTEKRDSHSLGFALDTAVMIYAMLLELVFVEPRVDFLFVADTLLVVVQRTESRGAPGIRAEWVDRALARAAPLLLAWLTVISQVYCVDGEGLTAGWEEEEEE